MLKMLGLTYYNIKMLKNDFFSSLSQRGGAGGGVCSHYNYHISMRYKTSNANEKEQKERRKQLRNNSTAAEVILWNELKGRKVGGLKFRRQQGLGPYILDFYCPEIRLCVELDGSSHDMKNEYDMSRTSYLNSQGIMVIRFPNDHVMSHVMSVVNEILRFANQIQKSGQTPTPSP